MQGAALVNVTDWIDRRPLGAFQIRIVALCGLVALLDGFDLQVIGLAAPAITGMLRVSPKAFGAVLSAAPLGLMLGALVLGPLADRFGRKRILIVSTVAFGIFTLCTARSGSLPGFVAFRFLTGLGLGGAMPSFISLSSEYTPKARRAVLVGVLWAGFPLGGVLGGLLAAQLLEVFGWRSLFYIGGAAPLVLAPFLLWLLPESIGFLVAKAGAGPVVLRLVNRIDPRAAVAPETRFCIEDEPASGGSIRFLLSRPKAFGTTLLWVAYFTTFAMLVTNVTWTPTLLHGAGLDVRHLAVALAVFNLGSVAGTSLAGFLIGRFGARVVLPVVFVGAALALGATGYAVSSVWLVTGLEGLAGCFLGAGSSGLIALATVFYPISVRSTGLGWAMGLGRFGSFVGPIAMGVLVDRDWPIGAMFVALAAPALCAALCSLMIASHRSLAAGKPAYSGVHDYV